MRKSQVQTRLCLAALTLALVAQGCEGDGRAEVPSSPRRGERALPRFDGITLDGEPLSTDLFRRKRGVILVFGEREQDADMLAELVAAVAPEATRANVAFLGVSRDDEPEQARSFARRHGLDFPILLDRSRAISNKLRVAAGTAALFVVDGEGYLMLAFSSLASGVEAATYERAVREVLRIEAADGVSGSFGVRPQAPPFTVERLDGGDLQLRDLDGKVVVVVFFLHTCPHCHDALRFLAAEKKRIASEDLAIVPISVQNRPDGVRGMAATLGTGLELYIDADGSAARAYAHSGAVPDTVILDRQHRVIARHGGIEPRIEALIAMQIRRGLGLEAPLLLSKQGYNGQESCATCHQGAHETWSLTNHAYAFDTLVEHGSNRDPECLPCHTVGWDQPGGYSLTRPVGYLEGVQCESCHGRGGPHQSPDFLTGGFEQVCLGCHTPEHSLRFAFAERLPLISHAANQQFAALSQEERRALVARRDKRERQLFEKADFVGSARCQSCHAGEYQIWSESPHAHAWQTLEAHEAAGNGDCQRCHSTGFEETGGFPAGGDDLRGVGCESCHGPGGNHVEEEARRSGTILALTDKCETCVLLQICGSCHDDANDPGFEFEVLDKLELIRHGFRDREPPGAAE